MTNTSYIPHRTTHVVHHNRSKRCSDASMKTWCDVLALPMHGHSRCCTSCVRVVTCTICCPRMMHMNLHGTSVAVWWRWTLPVDCATCMRSSTWFTGMFCGCVCDYVDGCMLTRMCSLLLFNSDIKSHNGMLGCVDLHTKPQQHHPQPLTVLLTKEGKAKLGDFGLVRLLSNEHEVLHATKMICSQACMCAGVVLVVACTFIHLLFCTRVYPHAQTLHLSN